jgi:diguanylate cyclase (GGDEF)-like protein
VVKIFSDLYPSLASELDAVGGKRVLHDIALAHREVQGLNDIVQAAGSSLGVADAMALLSSRLGALVPFSCCALFLRSGEPDLLRCAFAAGVDADAVATLNIPDGRGLNGLVVRTRRPIVNGHPRLDFEAAGQAVAKTSLQSGLVCPLLVEGRAIGTLALYHTRDGVYDGSHRRLVERIVEQAAAAIHRARVFEQTQADSLTDPLTGLPNARFMAAHVRRELARASRLRTEVTLLVVDVDDFKDVNDTYGHHVGDRALKAIGGALRAAIRPYDVCARYAGDEFVAVLSGCGVEEAERKRADVQAAVAAVPFEARAGELRALSVSAGASVYPHDGEDQERLLAAADGRMYLDKTRRKQMYPDVKDGTTGMA